MRKLPPFFSKFHTLGSQGVAIVPVEVKTSRTARSRPGSDPDQLHELWSVGVRCVLRGRARLRLRNQEHLRFDGKRRPHNQPPSMHPRPRAKRLVGT